MSPETRSRVMSRIRGRDTKPNWPSPEILRACGLDFDSHARDLPGRPDFVIRERRVAIFCDGDFWHGWRFSLWRLKLSEKWERKIEANRQRDVRNHRALRAKGFTVVRCGNIRSEQPGRLRRANHAGMSAVGGRHRGSG